MRTVITVALAGIALASCSDAAPLLTLSPDDAAEVYVEATLQPYLLAVPLINSRAAPSAINTSAPCDSSGSIAITGTADSIVNLSAVLTNCRVRHFQMGGTVTIAGNFYGQLAASLNWHGILTLTGPSSGDCWVDVVLTVDPTGQTLTGTVCGADAAQLPSAAKNAGLVG